MPAAASTKATRQYLERYAVAEVGALAHWPASVRCRAAVVVPAYQERSDFLLRAMQSLWFAPDTLLILVINQPDTDAETHPQHALYQSAQSLGALIWQADNLQLVDCRAKNHGYLLLVDRFTQPIPAKRGVGMARKIGTDLALWLISHGFMETQWLASTDADAHLPDHYFSALQGLPDDWVAAYYPFEHMDDGSTLAAATQHYQQALHYYVDGLRYANSPYAFFTIGSTLAFRADAYATVRGFPQRSAGEDFYLLNKLAKIGGVGQIDSAPIQLTARLSTRVPFGTGMSTAKILQQQQNGQPFCYYHPAIFCELKKVLNYFNSLWEQGKTPSHGMAQLPDISHELLEKAGFTAFLQAQGQQCRRQAQFEQQLHRWFDGLKTLQFIHGWRERRYADIPLGQAIILCTEYWQESP